MLLAPLLVATYDNTIDAGETGATFRQSKLRLSAAVNLFDELLTTSSRGARKVNLKVLYEAMQKLPASVKNNLGRGSRILVS